MRNMDRQATAEYGIPHEILMKNAGQAAYYTIQNEFDIKNKNFVVFCGVGISEMKFIKSNVDCLSC